LNINKIKTQPAYRTELVYLLRDDLVRHDLRQELVNVVEALIQRLHVSEFTHDKQATETRYMKIKKKEKEK
jgi:hypothetical protein